jgi:Tol biopolymer transport system component
VGWSPDGRHIVVGDASGPAWRIAIVNTRSAAVRLLIGHTSDVNPRWSPDGQTLAYLHLTAPGEGALRVQSLDGSSLTLARGLFPPRVGWEYAWSPDSRALAFVSTDGDLSSIDRDGTGERVLETHVDSSPAWSPDSSTLAVTTVDYLTNGHRIVLVGADGSASPLSPPPGAATAAAWSPDGASLFYLDESAGQGSSLASLWTPATRHSRVLVQVHVSLSGAFSPDGARVYVELHGDSSTNGLIVDLGDSGEADGAGVGRATWSPDGSSLAYERNGGVEIRSSPRVGDGGWRSETVIPRASDPSWQPVP